MPPGSGVGFQLRGSRGRGNRGLAGFVNCDFQRGLVLIRNQRIMGKIGGYIGSDCLFQHFSGVVFVNRVDFAVVGVKIRLKSGLEIRQRLPQRGLRGGNLPSGEVLKRESH